MSNIVEFKLREYGIAAAWPAGAEPCSVIILPVVRIERNPDIPADDMDKPFRRRRRRSSRK